jgi:hypothetical protein
MESGIGIWNKVCVSIACIGFTLCVPGSHLLAQDSFRDFDRKMVATPAELYEHLSALHPTKNQKQIDPQRRKKIEEAGRDLLSKLSPEQQDKAWEFAEKYLRKNGVDSASAQKLMQEFGLPPELQSELSKQFRRLGSNRSGSDAGNGGAQDRDAISQLMRKAREQFRKADLQDGAKEQASPSNRPYPNTDSTGNTGSEGIGDGRQGSKEPQMIPGREANRANVETGRPNSANSPTGRQANDQIGPGTQNGNRNGAKSSQRSGLQSERRSARRSDSSKRSRPMMPRNRARGNNTTSEAELEKLMEQVRENTKTKEEQQKRRANGNALGPQGDIDWEKVIRDLAEKEDNGIAADLKRALEGGSSKGQNGANQNGESSKAQTNKGMFDRAKEWISGSGDSNKKSEANSSGGIAGNGSGKKEKVGTRFDRLLVKAVDRTLDRTLESRNEQSVSKGVSGALGNLIKRFQEQESKEQAGKAEESGRRASERKSGGRRNRNSRRESGTGQIARNDSGDSNRSSNSRSGPTSEPQLPRVETPSINPRSLLDSIPDLSSINPAHIFTFFAIAGFVLFVGYLLTQSFAGDEMATERKKRAVIKKVRSTTIKTPKDLVETVDMFLLAKFGIKSSWWNAALAQRILNSGSADLQSQVDDLFRDYVRARYMRADVQIPEADQQRFKQTLEELSKLDIKPGSDLGFVAAKDANTSVSLEG